MTAGRYPYNHGGVREITPALHDVGGTPTSGKVFFVDSGNGNAGTTANEGQKRQPFSTIDAAVAQCTANNGDKIIVLPGHAETIIAADQIDLDVAGISVIGVGTGTSRPTLTYTVAAGEVVVGADNVTIDNIVFTSSVTAVLKAVDIEDSVDYTTIRNCLFNVEAANTDEFNATITMVNNNTGTLIENCEIDMGLGGAVSAIDMTADTERTTIRNCYIHGDYSTACINGDTALSTDVLIEGNTLVNGGSGNIGTVACIVLLTGTTGLIQDNKLVANIADPISSDTTIETNNIITDIVASNSGGVSSSYNPLLGFKVTKADANLPQSTTETAFTVSGGRVLVTRMTAEIGTVVQTQACNLSVLINPTTGTSGTVASTLDITATEAGGIGLVEGDGSAFIMIDAGTTWAAAGNGLQPFEANIGTLDVLTSASNTGTIKWELWYFPLEAGASVA